MPDVLSETYLCVALGAESVSTAIFTVSRSFEERRRKRWTRLLFFVPLAISSNCLVWRSFFFAPIRNFLVSFSLFPHSRMMEKKPERQLKVLFLMDCVWEGANFLCSRVRRKNCIARHFNERLMAKIIPRLRPPFFRGRNCLEMEIVAENLLYLKLHEK